MTLEKINNLSRRDAVTAFKLCCSSARWAEELQSQRPFSNIASLLGAADEIWESLGHEEWEKAFSLHPRIGDMKSLRKRFFGQGIAARSEQSDVLDAPERTLKALADANKLYEAKFGYIFIVCATGKTADEMLEILSKRLNNRPKDEIAIAGREHAAITRLRLQRLLSDSTPS